MSRLFYDTKENTPFSIIDGVMVSLMSNLIYERIILPSFCVIGKEGSSLDGEGFVQNLWLEANTHFNEVSDLAVYDENGALKGIWGAMSDFSFRFLPWENGFTRGLYLAGIEVLSEAIAPEGWSK